MRFAVVGIGQTFNFVTKEMVDTLQVDTPQGVVSVPTTNEAAQALVKLAMDGSEPQRMRLSTPPPREDDHLGQQVRHAHVQPAGVHSVADIPEEDFPDGAAVFGGEETSSMAEPTQMFAKTHKAAPKAQLGAQRNATDRSGVPSYGISRVDASGNPVLPAAPDQTMDDEEDPGEQI